MAMELCSGVCTHGKPILWFGNSVMFVEDCRECVARLRSEGFDVTIATAPAAARARWENQLAEHAHAQG